MISSIMSIIIIIIIIIFIIQKVISSFVLESVMVVLFIPSFWF